MVRARILDLSRQIAHTLVRVVHSAAVAKQQDARCSFLMCHENFSEIIFYFTVELERWVAEALIGDGSVCYSADFISSASQGNTRCRSNDRRTKYDPRTTNPLRLLRPRAGTSSPPRRLPLAFGAWHEAREFWRQNCD